MTEDTPDHLLRRLFDAAVAAADPMRCVPSALPPRPEGRVVVIGAGKASARMAEAVKSVWGPCEGIVVTRHGHARPCAGIRVLEAGHPVPDEAGLAATRAVLDRIAGLREDDLVLALISGGASALLVAPADPVTLADKADLNRALLASGASIDAINTVRKHLSRVKGGQLAAAAWPARVVSLIISDVPGDDLALIASGPTVGDTTSPAEARAILSRHGIVPPRSVETALVGRTGVLAPGDRHLSNSEARLIAAPAQSLAAAMALAQDAGCTVETLGDAVEGEARDVAGRHAALATAVQDRLRPGDPPHLILSGGECTVTRRGDGIGGPNAEYALAFALALRGQPGIHALACDTDGIDGAAEVAGAIVGPDTLARARARGVDPVTALATNDAHGFFARAGGQVITGPTLTNVNDFRAILVAARG